MWFNRKESTQVLQGEVMGFKPVSAHEGLIKHWLIMKLVYLVCLDFWNTFDKVLETLGLREVGSRG